MLAPGGEFEGPSALANLALESLVLYRDFVRELEHLSGLSVDYQECGALDLAYSDAEWQELQVKAERQVSLGIQSKPLGVQQIATFWPRVRSQDLAGALFYPADALVNPRDLIDALIVSCQRAGVEIREQTAVSEVVGAGKAIEFTTSRGSQETADSLVVAAGAWSSLIQLREGPPLPEAEPVKGHLIGFHQPEQTCSTILRHGHTYLLQRANGLLVAGASVERVGWDQTIHGDIAAQLAQQAGFVLPHLVETTPTEVWVGFRPGSAALQLGPWHNPRLILAYGHYRNGILLAPVTARRVESQVTASLQTP